MSHPRVKELKGESDREPKRFRRELGAAGTVALAQSSGEWQFGTSPVCGLVIPGTKYDKNESWATAAQDNRGEGFTTFHNMESPSLDGSQAVRLPSYDPAQSTSSEQLEAEGGRTSRENASCNNFESAAIGSQLEPWEQHAGVINMARFDYRGPQSLMKGQPGFFITCAYRREKSATKEALELLREYLHPGVKESGGGNSRSDNSNPPQQEDPLASYPLHHQDPQTTRPLPQEKPSSPCAPKQATMSSTSAHDPAQHRNPSLPCPPQPSAPQEPCPPLQEDPPSCPPQQEDPPSCPPQQEDPPSCPPQQEDPPSRPPQQEDPPSRPPQQEDPSVPCPPQQELAQDVSPAPGGQKCFSGPGPSGEGSLEESCRMQQGDEGRLGEALGGPGLGPVQLSLVKLACMGVVFIALEKGDCARTADAEEAVRSLLRDLRSGKCRAPRWCQRMLPVNTTCALAEAELGQATSRVVGQYLTTRKRKMDANTSVNEGPIKFAVGFKNRGAAPSPKEALHASVSRGPGPPLSAETSLRGASDKRGGAHQRWLSVVAEAVHSTVKSQGETCRVDLSDPQMAVIVEVLPVSSDAVSKICAISVLGREMVDVKPRLAIKSLTSKPS